MVPNRGVRELRSNNYEHKTIGTGETHIVNLDFRRFPCYRPESERVRFDRKTMESTSQITVQTLGF